MSKVTATITNPSKVIEDSVNTVNAALTGFGEDVKNVGKELIDEMTQKPLED